MNILRWPIIIFMIKSMIFFPEKAFYEKPQDYDFDWEDAYVMTSDRVQLHGWYLDAGENNKGTVLFLHGNAGNISGRLYKSKGWVERGLSVFLIDYRSYGLSEGEIKHQDDLVRDAEAALDWLNQKKKVSIAQLVVFGESLGSYPATQLAAKHRVAALVLEAPFTSFVDLADKHYPVIPGKEIFLKDFAFSNEKSIEAIQAPLFILHGTNDEICPYEMSESLLENAPDPKGFFTIPNGTHNDLAVRAGEDYWQKPFEFVSKYIHD